jgi:hypothetical protein
VAAFVGRLDGVAEIVEAACGRWAMLGFFARRER